MKQPCRPPLKANPFTTYRDPQTGQWQVIPAGAFSLVSDHPSEIRTATSPSEVISQPEAAIALEALST
jgi:hypothetical protein